MKKLRVAVLCGGKSAERRVSLVSAKLVLDSLDRKRFQPQLVFIDPQGRWFKADENILAAKVQATERARPKSKALNPADFFGRGGHRPDAVFPVLHGPLGEDGTVQGMLEVFDAPYVGCGVLGSALGMDKDATKRLARQAGIPVLPYLVVRRRQEAEAAVQLLGLPLFVKPARLGSSVGVSKVKRSAAFAAALKTAFLYDDKVIVERGVEAREIECAVLGDPWRSDPSDPLRLQASVCGEIEPNTEFFSYKSKYLDPAGAEQRIPATVPAATAHKIQNLSLRAFRALDGYGMARVDFLMDKKTGAVYFNEINTIPGFTPKSMYPLLWNESGLSTTRLVTRLIDLALRRHRARAKLKTTP